MTHVHWVNNELISFADSEGIVYDLYYKERIELYYKYLGHQTFEQILSNLEIVKMFGVFGRTRIVNIYICEVNLIALKVVHLGDEEYSDVGKDSEHTTVEIALSVHGACN